MHEWITQEVHDTAKLNGKKIIWKQEAPTDEQARTAMIPSCWDGRMTKSIKSLWKFMDGQKIIVGSWSASRRSAPPTAHPSYWYPMMLQTLTILQREQGRQNVKIPKNGRALQRPFNEALRADQEWHSQNSRSHWSNTSSSSSPQKWWWHEHQDDQWQDQHRWKEWWTQTLSKTYRIVFTDFACRHYRMSCTRREVKTEHLVARTFFSVLRTWSQIITRTCVRLKCGMCCTFAHLKSHPLTTCFIDHSLLCLTHVLLFVPHHLPPHRLRCLWTGIRRSPCAAPHGGFQFGRFVEPTPLTWSGRANDIDVPWSGRKVLKELKHDGHAAVPRWHEWVERESIKCRRPSIRSWAIGTVATSWSERKGERCSKITTGARDRRVGPSCLTVRTTSGANNSIVSQLVWTIFWLCAGRNWANTLKDTGMNQQPYIVD